MNKPRSFFLVFLLGLFVPVTPWAQDHSAPYKDVAHASKVFGKEKYYRLYLPKGYHTGQEKFPVVYFFHGWGGRHFKDDNAKLEYAMIKGLVDKYRVILVMWDGNIEEKEPRPYNMGYHENVTSNIQMKDYFIELAGHIDANYRTLTDRGHRGLIGFSMGGLMSYFLAGKYPDKVCAAVGLVGSPEFYIGYPNNHTLYPIRYAFKNLEGIRLRFHNSTHDELVYLNDEVYRGAKWHGGLSFDFWRFYGGHIVDLPGKTDAFEKALKFVVDAFKDLLPRPQRWWHYDLYPEFEVWDYKLTSNKAEPGFVYLKNVSPTGFGVNSTQWLPDGPPISDIIFTVTTSPTYIPNVRYNIVKRSANTGEVERYTATADGNGRLSLSCEGGSEFGIYEKSGDTDLTVVDFTANNGGHFIRPGVDQEISVRFFNRFDSQSGPLTMELSTKDSTVTIGKKDARVEFKENQPVAVTEPFKIRVVKNPPAHGEPAWIKFLVKLSSKPEVADDLIVPILFDVPKFENIKIDDGKNVKDKVYGKGNADGAAAAGENVMLYADDHRLRLYTDDPYVIGSEEKLADEVLPSKWPDGFTLSSIIKISEKCPPGHTIEFLANYETKKPMPIERNLTWGKVKITIAP